MRQNVERALEREGHLDQLQSRAQNLRQAVGPRGQAGTRGGGAVTLEGTSGTAAEPGQGLGTHTPGDGPGAAALGATAGTHEPAGRGVGLYGDM